LRERQTDSELFYALPERLKRHHLWVIYE